MSKNTFTRSELRLPENPYHSVLSQPWAMVAIGGLMARLHYVECPQCNSPSLFRRYFADMVALLAPQENTPEWTERRSSLSTANTIDLAMMAADSPALIYCGPHELKGLRTSLPSFVRDFFTESKAALAYPLAMQKGVAGPDGEKVMGDFCPHCQAELTGRLGDVLTTVIVTKGNEPCLMPVPVICQL